MTELAAEDALRLNVLLTRNLRAIRIDESKLVVHALSDQGELKIQLNPNTRTDRYVKQVKALLATHVLGSPGGYPVFLDLWTRMGQARDQSLQQLLLLGEPEAIVAVAHAAGLTTELAKLAWWAHPNADNARQMLKNHSVINAEIGSELAHFLLEFLPFEEKQLDMIESVRLVLQSQLIDQTEVEALWSKATLKPHLLVGFLQSRPDNLPMESISHPTLDLYHSYFPDNDYRLLYRVVSSEGQAFVQTAIRALRKPSTQEAVIALFLAIERYFNNCDQSGLQNNKTSALDPENLMPLKVIHESIIWLQHVKVDQLNSILGRTDSVGSVMRKKLKPIVDPIIEKLESLLAE
ncbi:MAG: hypothetical protein ACI845_003118 [Gammaproteobacteria bacterium]|jgi:hypothetical protein